MKVEIWSDVVCPFCYIGKRRFEKALEGFAGKEQVEIEWKSFQLDPELDNREGLSVHAYLGQRKGGTEADGRRMNEQMAAMAKTVGLDYDFDKAILNNTRKAHQVLHFAKSKALQSEMKERLFKAYYTEGKDIADTDTLTALAAEAGLPAEEVRTALADERYTAEVQHDQEEAYRIGVQGVPFFVFNRKYAVSGAQSPETFAQVLQQVWEEEKPSVIASGGEGVCDINGNC